MSVKSCIDRYIKEEYGSITPETAFVGKLLFNNVKGKVLDFGCGPSLLYWAMFMQNATSIDAFDILSENIEYLKNLLVKSKKPEIYYKLADWLLTHGLAANPYSKKDKSLVMDAFKKIGKLKVANILKSLPFKKKYDYVTEIGCIGCVNSESELLIAVKNMYARLKKDGSALFVNWLARRTDIAEEVPQFDGMAPISIAIFKKVFKKAGFRNIKLAYKKNKADTGFATIIYGTAKR